MAGGGRFKIKGGVASFGEAVVQDGAVLVTVDGAVPGSGNGFIEHSFLQSADGSTTEIDVMQGSPIGPGLAILREVEANSVGVSILHNDSPDGGTWTLRLLRKAAPATSFSEVATFTFDT